MAKRRGWLRTLIVWGVMLALVVPAVWVGLYRFLPPPATVLMLQRRAQGEGLDYRWRSLDRISPELQRAVIASEDARFCEHRGFDTAAIRKALASNQENPERVRGGSTISQQTAKNAFLWPQRSWLRKGLEAWFTFWVELLWPKARVLEVYLNVAEWGPGVYGAEAASRHWFGKSADRLSRLEAARLAAILPSPRRYRAASPGPYVRRRTRATLANMGVIRRDGLAGCL
jgi:monofunctional biosynthetic peptidoglycan transglycosylase